MQILQDNQFPYIIESVNHPISPRYLWTYDSVHQDLMLKKITLLEETIGPSLIIRVNGLQFALPCTWFIMITDQNNLYLDSIRVDELKNSTFDAVLFCPSESGFHKSLIEIITPVDEMSCAYPGFERGDMMLHPVGPVDERADNIWSCVIGPVDLSKFLTGLSPKSILI